MTGHRTGSLFRSRENPIFVFFLSQTVIIFDQSYNFENVSFFDQIGECPSGFRIRSNLSFGHSGSVFESRDRWIVPEIWT